MLHWGTTQGLRPAYISTRSAKHCSQLWPIGYRIFPKTSVSCSTKLVFQLQISVSAVWRHCLTTSQESFVIFFVIIECCELWKIICLPLALQSLQSAENEIQWVGFGCSNHPLLLESSSSSWMSPALEVSIRENEFQCKKWIKPGWWANILNRVDLIICFSFWQLEAFVAWNEDQHRIAGHIQTMKKKTTKTNPSLELLDNCMKRTFVARWELVIQGPSISDVIDE